MNRYPQLFEIAAKELKDTPNPKILSFGCSTGEEVFTIKQYIPNADIIGIDINRRAISIAKKRDPIRAFRFFHYLDNEWTLEAPYDCIFAMAVFQRPEHRDSNRKTTLDSFPFNKFEQMVGELDSLLKPEGLLVIEHSDFSFQDLPFSKKFSTSEMEQPVKRERPILSKQNVKVSSSHVSHCIFIKGSS
jgi:methylase of polypeptide subunit release factors